MATPTSEDLAYAEALQNAKRFARSLRSTLHMQGTIYPRRGQNRIELLAAAAGGKVLHATYFPGGKCVEWLETTSLKKARQLIEV